MGGMPHGPAGQTWQTTLGHELAGEIAAARADVTGPKIDDRGVITPRTAPSRIINCAGAADYALIRNDAARGVAACPGALSVEVAPCPTEVVDVGPQLAEHAELISRRFPVPEVHDAFQLALTTGAAKKAVVTSGD
jgi:Alcohol dehydrogenase GroES-like domain